MNQADAIEDAEVIQRLIEDLDWTWRSTEGEPDETNIFEWCVRFARFVLSDVKWRSPAEVYARVYKGDRLKPQSGDHLRSLPPQAPLRALFGDRWEEEVSTFGRTQEDLRAPQARLRTLLASTDERWAWEALNLIAQDLLREGTPLPPELAAWVADVLEDQFLPDNKKKQGRQPRPRKRGPASEYERDQYICALVCHLGRYGLKPTRRKPGEGRACVEGGSVCDAVGRAANLGYKAVESIYGKRAG